MKLLKVKGIVIKETQYNDNDKILTVFTDELGKISCMAKGAKKTNSSLLAPCQFLVYSEFVLYKGTSFYHINSAEIIDTFYNLRIDYDKLNIAYDITKVLMQSICEGEESKEVLSLFLNTMFVIENKDIPAKQIETIFKLKLLSLLGYMPNIVTCNKCGNSLVKGLYKNYYYSFAENNAICENCFGEELSQMSKNKTTYVKMSQAVYFACVYVVSSPVKKIFSFSLDDACLNEFIQYVDMLYSVVMF